MKIVQINTFSYKATGNIMFSIHNELQKRKIDSYVVWGRGRESRTNHEIFINDKWGIIFHGVYTRLTDRTGFASWNATKRLIKELDEIEPDIIHLHNIHGYYINIKMLFEYIKQKQIKVVWTLHDCWSFTGHCACYDMCGCSKWKNGCNKCNRKNAYPKSYIDNSMINWKEKKELFNYENMVLVTPSVWLHDEVKKSFFKEKEIKIINNGIDIENFAPQKSSFRTSYGLQEAKVILGVASEWREEKGLDDFILLAGLLPSNYRIVMIGTDKKIDKILPKEIISIHRTNNVQELAEIYTSADVFVNLTKEDNFPTVNIEALACGTPIITYNTGGSPEIIDKSCGVVVQKNDIKTIANEIIAMCEKEINVSEQCRKRAVCFKKENMISSYLKLYSEIGEN